MRWLGDEGPAPAAAAAPTAARCVLVADDNADMREYLASLLAEEYRVETARGRRDRAGAGARARRPTSC